MTHRPTNYQRNLHARKVDAGKYFAEQPKLRYAGSAHSTSEAELRRSMGSDDQFRTLRRKAGGSTYHQKKT
jgi:hypothetical protein